MWNQPINNRVAKTICYRVYCKSQSRNGSRSWSWIRIMHTDYAQYPLKFACSILLDYSTLKYKNWLISPMILSKQHSKSNTPKSQQTSYKAPSRLIFVFSKNVVNCKFYLHLLDFTPFPNVTLLYFCKSAYAEADS